MTKSLALATMTGVLLLCAPARGQSTDSKAAAEALFDQGRQLMIEKRFAEACPKLAESLKLDPGTGTRLFLADCYENSSQTASAWAEFREAAAFAGQQHDPREAVARRRAEALEPRLTKLVLVVPPEAALPGLELRRDGLLVPASELGMAIPVDPGIHALEAVAPQHTPWSTTVQLPGSPGSVSVTVPVLEATSTASSAPASAAASNLTASSAPPLDALPVGQTQRTIGLVVGATGVVGLVLGGVFALHAKSTYDGANANNDCLPDNECNAAGKQARSDASSWATGSTVAVALGAAAVAGGAVLYLTAARASLQVTPAQGATGATVTVARTW